MQSIPTYCDSYFYDDLLCNTTREIIANGMETPNVPSTLKDWVSGKVMSALPEQLVKRLINFVFENRNSNQIAYKESRTGDEFTLLVYRTERQFKTREKLLVDEILKRESMGQREYDRMFNEIIDLEKNGLNYFADELICEAGAQVPMSEAVKISKKIMEYNGVELQNLDGMLQPAQQYHDGKSLADEIMDSNLPSGRIKIQPKNRLPPERPPPNQVNHQNFVSALEGNLSSAFNHQNNSAEKPNNKRKSSGGKDSEKKPRGAQARLAAWNEAMRNAKAEGLTSINQEDEDKLAEWNAVLEAEGCGTIDIDHEDEDDAQDLHAHDTSCTSLDGGPPNKKRRNTKGKHRLRIPEPTPCPVCDKLFPGRRKGLWEHMKNQHKEEWPAYWAANRPKTARLAQMDEYQEHFHTDPKTGDYICIPCGGRFTAAQRFLKHLRKVHLKIKDYKCAQCGLELTSLTNYKSHLISHTGELPHGCIVCQKRFLRHDKLMEHYKCMHHETYLVIRAEREAEKEQRKKETAERYKRDKEEKAAKRALARAEKRTKMPERVQMQYTLNRMAGDDTGFE